MTSKASTTIALIAMGLILASSGVLYPIQGNVSGLEDEVGQLDQQRIADEAVRAQVQELHAQVTDMRERSANRSARLCPDTPEALQGVETMVLENVLDAGLVSVRMDSGATNRTGRFPFRTIDLVVEGNASSLLKFLVSLEGMPWVTRVLQLKVEQGAEQRRINLQVAVMLEAES